MPSTQVELKTVDRSVHDVATVFARSHVRMRRLVHGTVVVAVAVRPCIDLTADDTISSLADSFRCPDGMNRPIS
jgi:hypothetical protein